MFSQGYSLSSIANFILKQSNSGIQYETRLQYPVNRNDWNENCRDIGERQIKFYKLSEYTYALS